MDITNLKLGEHDFLITEVDLSNGSIHSRYFIIPLPTVSEQGFYRTVTSYNAFFNGIKRRNWTKKFLYTSKDSIDYKITRDVGNKTAKKFKLDFSPFNKESPVQRLDSLWDFYKVIGFDNKTKKWSH